MAFRSKHPAAVRCRLRADRVPRDADVAPGMVDGLLGRPRVLATRTALYGLGYRLGAAERARIWSQYDAGRRVA